MDRSQCSLGLVLFGLCFGYQQASGQGSGGKRVIVLAEPNVIRVPAGSEEVPATAVTVEKEGLREILARHRVATIRTSAQSWEKLRQAYPAIPVHTLRKGSSEPLQPDAFVDLSHLFVLQLPDTADAVEIVRQLNASDGIVSAELDQRARSLRRRDRGVAPTGKNGNPGIGVNHLMLDPNDFYYAHAENYYTNQLRGGSFSIEAPGAWDLQTGIPAIRIGFIEPGGIHQSHPDLNLLARGVQYDFWHNDPVAEPEDGGDDHGTNTFGVALALSNNNVGMPGVCGGRSITGQEGCSVAFASFYSTSEAIAAITWMVSDAQALVINNSWCVPSPTHGLYLAFRNAFVAGKIVVASVGNTEGEETCGQFDPSQQVQPAAYRHLVVSVGASNASGNRTVDPGVWESALYPDVMAPNFSDFTTSLIPGGYLGAGGTSIAAPYVSGLAGLIASENTTLGLQLTHWDIMQLIRVTARQNTLFRPNGVYNDSTGWGVIHAAAALQALQPPNQHTVTYVTPGAGTQCFSLSGWTTFVKKASNTAFIGRRCEIRFPVTYTRNYVGTPLVWGRPHPDGGVAPDSDNPEITFTDVVPLSGTSTGATIRTYLWEIYENGSPVWYPRAPSAVTLSYSVLGNSPFVVTATAPSLVTVKGTYSLTGTATDLPATGWLWEQSYNGGAYSLWSNQQNSSFFANAATYTLGWRLSATRLFDNARDTSWATTLVCVPFNPACYQLRADDAVSTPTPMERAPKVVGNHFGSGLWIALRQRDRQHLVRMYGFDGRHDSSTRSVPWPNILERDGGDWAFRTPIGDITVATQRHKAGANRFVLRATGRLSAFKGGSLDVALAADPDLGDPSDDVLGFESDIGLVWVHESASGTYLGYLRLGSDSAVRVRQLVTGSSGGPSTGASALELMHGSGNLVSGQRTDVQFLFTGPESEVGPDGAFVATFVVLEARSFDALVALAKSTVAEATSLLAGVDDASTSASAGEFSLRQSLRRSSMQVASPNSGSAASVAQLQADGLRALEYTVPMGQEIVVRIRLYNSRGQLVRTLVDQQVQGGSYNVEWDGLNERGHRVPPGVYVAIMEAGAFRATRKLALTH